MLVLGLISPHPPIILPEVGGEEIRKVQATIQALEHAAHVLAESRPDKLIIIAPHKDHGFEVPLYYLTKHLPKDILIERILVTDPSDQYYYELGQSTGQAIKKETTRTAIIASGDLSHVLKADGPYGYNAGGPQLDELIVTAVRTNDATALLEIDQELLEQGAECGLRSIVFLFGAVQNTTLKPRLLAYEGPFGVGYLTAVFETNTGAPSDTTPELNLANLARVAIRHYLTTHQVLATPDSLPLPLQQSAGVFVSLHQPNGELRGCIGTLTPQKSNLADEVIANAIAAATQDPRFPALASTTELTALVLSVDRLGPPSPANDVSKLDPAYDGLIVTASDGRQGVLLPNLDGVETVEAQIAICRDKAGIGTDESIAIATFKADRYNES